MKNLILFLALLLFSLHSLGSVNDYQLCTDNLFEAASDCSNKKAGSRRARCIKSELIAYGVRSGCVGRRGSKVWCKKTKTCQGKF